MCSFFTKKDFTADIDELTDLIEDKVNDIEEKCKERDDEAKDDIEKIESKLKEVEEENKGISSYLESVKDLQDKFKNLLQEQSKLKDSIDLLIKASENDETQSKHKATQLQAQAEANQTNIVSLQEMFQQVRKTGWFILFFSQ